MSMQITELGNGRTWTLGDRFVAKFPHHEGVKALWETKWKFPVGATSKLSAVDEWTHL